MQASFGFRNESPHILCDPARWFRNPTGRTLRHAAPVEDGILAAVAEAEPLMSAYAALLDGMSQHMRIETEETFCRHFSELLSAVRRWRQRHCLTTKPIEECQSEFEAPMSLNITAISFDGHHIASCRQSFTLHAGTRCVCRIL